MSDVLSTSALDANGTRQIALNRPERANAIDAELGDALLAALQAAASDGTRFLVLRANGRHFSGGFHLSDRATESDGDLLLRFVRIEQALQLLSGGQFVSIARTHNAAIGAGADLVAACTYRVGTPSSRFRFPGFRFGVALGTRRLAVILGEDRARDLLLTNRTIGGEEALDCGLLTHLVAEEQLDATIDGIIAQIRELEAPSIAALLAAAQQCRGEADRDLALLVRSAARPGLHARIERYRASIALGQGAQR